MSGVRAQDRRRRNPFFMVEKFDLSHLAEVCESRQLPYARSVYCAVLELANDQRTDEAQATQAELATRAGVSVSTLKKCAATLCDAGLLEVQSGRLQGEPNVWILLSAGEDEGSRTTATWVAVPRLGGSRTTATPIETVQEGEEQQPSSSSGGAEILPDEICQDAEALLRRKAKVNGQIVTHDEMMIAAAALAEFNRQMESDFGLGAHLTPVVMRIRERPSWNTSKHVRLVQSAWRVKWWERRGGGRRPTPAVIYGNPKVFEQVAQDAAAEAAGRKVDPEEGLSLRHRRFGGRRWEDLTPDEQANLRESVSMGYRPWDGGDAPQVNGNGNGHAAAAVATQIEF